MPDFILLPFMQRALIAGVVLAFILPFLGVFVTLRKMSFFSDGIAHASLAGIALGIISGLNPMNMALIVGVFFGISVYVLERKTNVASDSVIGVIFTTGLALGVILLSFQQGYQPELISFLFGSILAVGSSDLYLIVAFSFFISLFLVRYLRDLTNITIDRDNAWLQGIPVAALELIFYIVLSMAIVLGVKLLGIILISALLITPAATAKLVSPSFKRFVAISIILGEISVVSGLALSYYFDLPSGAVIILVNSLLFIFALGITLFPKKAAV
ncbi:MAG: metal ABC transporter permease [Candidatus Spechtbacterales bacterium]